MYSIWTIVLHIVHLVLEGLLPLSVGQVIAIQSRLEPHALLCLQAASQTVLAIATAVVTVLQLSTYLSPGLRQSCSCSCKRCCQEKVPQLFPHKLIPTMVPILPLLQLHNCGCCVKEVTDALTSRLASAEVLQQQACIRPLSPDGSPIIGQHPYVAGAYIATGMASHACTFADSEAHALVGMHSKFLLCCSTLQPYLYLKNNIANLVACAKAHICWLHLWLEL